MIEINVGRCAVCGADEAVEYAMERGEDGQTRWRVRVTCPDCCRERSYTAERITDIRLRLTASSISGPEPTDSTTEGGTDDADLHGETDHQG